MPERPEPTTDLTSHHIQGWRDDTGPIAIPLISHIEGNLWTGGCIDGVRLADDFAFVVSLYPWEQYELGPTTVRLECRLYDAAELPDERQLQDLARIVNAFLSKGKTLVHCQAGLNRSGLVAALALVLAGRAPAEAVALLRDRRCADVLCNPTFERWLLERAATDAEAADA